MIFLRWAILLQIWIWLTSFCLSKQFLSHSSQSITFFTIWQCESMMSGFSKCSWSTNFESDVFWKVETFVTEGNDIKHIYELCGSHALFFSCWCKFLIFHPKYYFQEKFQECWNLLTKLKVIHDFIWYYFFLNFNKIWHLKKLT